MASFEREYNWKSARLKFKAERQEERTNTDKYTSFRSSKTVIIINYITFNNGLIQPYNVRVMMTFTLCSLSV